MQLGVLIAEDDVLVRLTMREALEAAGHKVEAVADGQEAMTRISQTPFDFGSPWVTSNTFGAVPAPLIGATLRLA